MARKIFLLRHGTPQQKDSQRRYIGITDLKLSEKGRAEAEASGLWLKENSGGIEKIFSSPLTRTLETAKTAAKFLDIPEVFTADGLREINLGSWEAKSVAEIQSAFPESFAERGIRAWDFRIPKGETFHEACERFSVCLTKILESTDGNILIVSHAGVMRAFLAKISGLPGDELFKIQIPMASLTVLTETEGKFEVLRTGFLPEETLTKEKIYWLYEKYKTPEKVIRHMEAVADFADEILGRLPENFNRNRIIKAALLHDLLRHKKGHAKLAAEALRHEGYDEIAKLVEVHNDEEFSPEAEISDADILWYSDKRVQDDHIVSLEERFSRSLKNCSTPKAIQHHENRRLKALSLHEKLKQQGVEL